MTSHWQNWAGNQSCQATIHNPSSTEEVVDLVNQLRATPGAKVRAANGGSHPTALDAGSFSYSPIAVNNGQHIVQVAGMDTVQRQAGTQLLDAGGGATTWQVSEQGNSQGLSLNTTTLIPWVSVGGATAVGANGQGWAYGTLSDQLQSIEIVSGTGSVNTYDRDTSPAEGWNAAMVHLGSLGIVTNATFRCVDRFKLRSVDHVLESDELVSEMAALVPSNEYVEMSWFPFNDKAWLKIWNKESWDTPNQGPEHGRLYDELQAYLGGKALEEVSKHPELTPPFLRGIMDTVTSNDNVAVAPSHEIFHWQMGYPKVWDLCYALPIHGNDFSAVQEAWRFAQSLVCTDASPKDGDCTSIDPLNYSKSSKFPQNLMLNCRFLGGSPALLSTAPETNGHTCYFEVTTSVFNKDYADYFAALGQKLRDLGGRPHWGKMWGDPLSSRETWTGWYGDNLDQFDSTRRQCDPTNMFVNDFTGMLFGVDS